MKNEDDPHMRELLKVFQGVRNVGHLWKVSRHVGSKINYSYSFTTKTWLSGSSVLFLPNQH